MSECKGTILVADDEPDSLALLSSILSSENYEVRAADSGKLALSSALAFPPDLILLDMRMPDMDGLEVCRQLKAHQNTKDVPLMFLSGSTGTEDRVEGLALGAVDFVVKPFFRPELLARVRTHLDSGGLDFNWRQA